MSLTLGRQISSSYHCKIYDGLYNGDKVTIKKYDLAEMKQKEINDLTMQVFIILFIVINVMSN